MRNILYNLVLLLLVSSSAQAVVLDRIVAVVNDDVITLSELKSLELSVLKTMSTRPDQENLGVNRERLLDDLIDKKIKLQKAEEFKIKVSDEELHAAIRQILSKNRISEEALREKLKSQGFTWDHYEKEIRDQIILSRLVNQEVRSKIILMPDEVKQYYQDHLDRFAVNEKKQVLRILLSLPEGASEEETRTRKKEAEDLHQRVRSGENFQEVAMRYSDGPEASDGGNLGYFSRGELRAELDEVVTHMGLGEISPVIQLKEGFVILKVEDIHAASHIPFEKVREEIREDLYQEKLRQRYREWIAELRNKSFIEKKKDALILPEGKDTAAPGTAPPRKGPSLSPQGRPPSEGLPASDSPQDPVKTEMPE